MMTSQNCHVTTSTDNEVLDFDWGRLTWYVSAEQGNSGRLTVGRCQIKPGCANPMHHHPNCDEVLHVLQGTIEHSIGREEAQRMGPGATISIAEGVVHNAKNIGDDEAVLMICFSSADRKTIGE